MKLKVMISIAASVILIVVTLTVQMNVWTVTDAPVTATVAYAETVNMKIDVPAKGTPAVPETIDDNAGDFTIDNGVLIKYIGQGYTATIPDSVTSIGDYAFSSCNNLENVTIPRTVITIGYAAFSFCPNLKSISITNGTKKIDEKAFESCENLKSLEIPDSVESIGEYAFSNCSSLESVIMSINVTSIGERAFYNTPWLNRYPDDFVVVGNQILIRYNNSVEKIIKIPNTVKSIGNSAFENCQHLTSLTIPDSITKIGSMAFDGCTNLEFLTIPSSVTQIESEAFSNCKSLAQINVDSKNLKYSSADGVLFDKAKLELLRYPEGKSGDYVIPNSVKDILGYAFYNCEILMDITIPTSVTSIGSMAFYNCTGLHILNLPISVTSIGDDVFVGCSESICDTNGSYAGNT